LYLSLPWRLFFSTCSARAIGIFLYNSCQLGPRHRRRLYIFPAMNRRILGDKSALQTSVPPRQCNCSDNSTSPQIFSRYFFSSNSGHLLELNSRSNHVCVVQRILANEYRGRSCSPSKLQQFLQGFLLELDLAKLPVEWLFLLLWCVLPWEVPSLAFAYPPSPDTLAKSKKE
jgi:hypothetical protein